MLPQDDFPQPVEFQWDGGNKDKNLIKHNVTSVEAEQVLLNSPLVQECDPSCYPAGEKRYAAFGITDSGRKLFIVYIVRHRHIRIISARDMSRKERRFYEDHP